ncbi:DUF6020 family protein [Catenibacterium mitsuokai]|uniref:DUF6020 family protein n=1 Tax=Catenibacterium mitsuokai TaxID=100886 RepID=UPI003F898DE5
MIQKLKNIFKIKIRFSWLLSIIFSAGYILGYIFLQEKHINSGMQAFKYIVAWLVGILIYHVLIQIFWCFVQGDYLQKNKKIQTWIVWQHPFVITFIFLCICWTIPIVLKYPAGICWDASWQIDQGMGNVPLTSHHPIFHTMLMAWFVKFGMQLHSANVGIFLFCVVEAIILALIFSFAIKCLVDLQAKYWSILLAVIFFGFSPFITGYVGTVIKDVYFVAMCVLYITTLIVYAADRELFWSKCYYSILFVLATVGMVLFRNNGLYMCAPTALVLMVYEFKKRDNKFIKHIVIIAMSCILAVTASKTLTHIYQPEKGSIAEALSLPFQQTARYVKTYGNEVTEKEKKIINKVLPYDQLGELYNPYVSDPVKFYFNRSATGDDLKQYLNVWWRQFLKHPTCYVKATVQQSIFLIHPGYNNYAYYLNSNANNYFYQKEQYFTTPRKIALLQQKYFKYLVGCHSVPIISLLNNMALYIMGMFCLLIFSWKKHNYNSMFFFVPLILSVLIILAAPCIRWHVRYAFPVIYTFPLILAEFTRMRKEDKNG